MLQFRQRALGRLARTLHYYATHETIPGTVQRYRDTGVSIGERVVTFDSTIEPVFPSLLTIGDDCIITNATLLCHDNSLVLYGQRRRAARVTIGKAAGRSSATVRSC